MMDQALVTQDDAQQLANVYEEQLKDIIEHSIELRSMKPGALRTSMALEYAKDARRYLEELEMGDLRMHTQRAYEVHRFLSGILKKLKKPAEILVKQCSDIRVDWEVERRRRIEEERAEREQAANQLVAEQRKAEIEHLKEIGHPEQAAVIAAQPMPAVSVSVDTNAGKPEGEVMVEVWRPKRDETGEPIFSDLTAYLHWIADRPEMHYLVKHLYGKLKQLLTANRGMVQPPGLEIEHTFEPRTRMSDD